MDDASAGNGLAWSLARLVGREGARLRPRDALGLLSLLLGDRAQVGDASRYLYHYARRRGYDLPPYPLAGCGEIRAFFADEGVRNVPEWYEKRLGVGPDDYAALPARTVVVVRDAANRRKAFFLEGVRHAQDAGFADLLASGIARSLSEEELADLLERVMAFLLEAPQPKRPASPPAAAPRRACAVVATSSVF